MSRKWSKEGVGRKTAKQATSKEEEQETDEKTNKKDNRSPHKLYPSSKSLESQDNIETRIILPSREVMKNSNENDIKGSTICKLYQQRRCKFGDHCYNLHIVRTEKDDNPKRYRPINTNPRL